MGPGAGSWVRPAGRRQCGAHLLHQDVPLPESRPQTTHGKREGGGPQGQCGHRPPVSHGAALGLWAPRPRKRGHVRALLTFGTGHCACAGHAVGPKQVSGTGSLQCRAWAPRHPVRACPGGGPRAARGCHLLQEIFRDFQDARAPGPAPCHTPRLAPLSAHWGLLLPAQLSIPRGTCT